MVLVALFGDKTVYFSSPDFRMRWKQKIHIRMKFKIDERIIKLYVQKKGRVNNAELMANSSPPPCV